jgi:uncharacterized NAD(P)/FAD-binding protein YdhS
MKHLAIVGGGPAALLVYKRLVESGAKALAVDIFEAYDRLGSGMPYSARGAGIEHVTNVSSDELPSLIVPLAHWVKSLPSSILEDFNLDRQTIHEKKVMPRLLFGQYLAAQFHDLLQLAEQIGITTHVHCHTEVDDIRCDRGSNRVILSTAAGDVFDFDNVVICTGHHWPGDYEGKVPGYFDSPYPPAKLARIFDHTVIVRGSSLTAVDAIRTMARSNGRFERGPGGLVFTVAETSPNFQVLMHSRHGLLPCVRVHMEEPHTAGKPLIEQQKIDENIRSNDGFLQLDFLFEQGFKEPLRSSDPAFYEQIKDMTLETFVDTMMSYREAKEPFELFKNEYDQAKISIRREEPVYWKEMLSALSFAMNYPAKYLSAEDMLRLQKHLMPLISVVIAFVPQNSCEELLALHAAGRLSLITDGADSTVEISDDGRIIYSWSGEAENPGRAICETFVDCTGQPHLSVEAFPFKSLVENGTISPAMLKFRSPEQGQSLLDQGNKDIRKLHGDYYLKVSGANITDNFQLVDRDGRASELVYLMAVPYMGGFNPDYSGLDFCEQASLLIVQDILQKSFDLSGQNPIGLH